MKLKELAELHNPSFKFQALVQIIASKSCGVGIVACEAVLGPRCSMAANCAATAWPRCVVPATVARLICDLRLRPPVAL